MSGAFSILLWSGLTIAGILAMQWGASRACGLLTALRKHWGLSAVGGGALMGLATASPEMAVNVTSVAFGWPDLGLGAALGSNVPALPLIITLSFLAKSWQARRDPGTPATPPPPRVQPEAVPVQIVPYLLVLGLLAILTLPPPWSGLQPVDGAILAAAFGLYLAHALRQKQADGREPMPDCTIRRALIGFPAIALGALVSVVAARQLTDAFGISDLVGGLFLIGLLCALPESFAAWRLTREGRTTTALSGAVADGIVSLTLALIPPALAGATVGHVPVYIINLAFLALVLITYMVLNHRGRGQELGPGRVSFYVAAYGIYVAATVLVLTA